VSIALRDKTQQLGSAARRLARGDLAKDTAWALGQQLLTIVLSLATFTVLGRQLGPEFVGTYAGIYAILGPLIGLSTGCKLLYLQITKDGSSDLDRDADRCIGLVLLAGVVLVALVAAISPVVTRGVALRIVLALAAMELLGQVVSGVVTAYVWTVDGFVPCCRLEMLQACTRFVPVAALASVDALSLGNIAAAMIVVTTLWTAGLFWWVHHRYGVLLRPRWPNVVLARRSGLFSIGITASGVQNDSDKAVLNANRFVVDAGHYAAAYRIVQMGFLPVMALAGSSHRRFLAPDEGIPGTHVRRAVRYAVPAVLYALAVSAVLWLLAPYVDVLLGDDFGPSVTMLRWLTLFLPLRASWTVALNALLGLDRPGLRSGLLVCSAVVSIGLYVVLIPRWSWGGAVAGTVVSEAVLAVLCWTAVVRVQRRRDRHLASAQIEGAPA